jgi:protein-L-isoaspartate O-methyltransferase
MVETPRLQPEQELAKSTNVQEPHLVACFRKTCRPGSVVFDIGASVGYHTLLLATLAGSEGKCYAFEPNSENCRLILLGCERNCLSISP